jgi:hypothetical protein
MGRDDPARAPGARRQNLLDPPDPEKLVPPPYPEEMPLLLLADARELSTDCVPAR